MRSFLRTTLLWIILAFVGDTLLRPAMTIKGVGPDFPIIALVVLALAAGPAPATIGGFVLGLVQGVSNPTLLGLQALCKTTLGFGLGRLRSRLVFGVPAVEGAVVAFSVLAHDFIFLLVQSTLTEQDFFRPLVFHTVPVAIYSGLVGIPVMRLAELLGILKQED